MQKLGYRKSRAMAGSGLRLLFAGLLALATISCAAPNQYMGISLLPGAAEPELQQLAQRARIGDKQAQLELGMAYEEGRGLPVRLDRAIALYRIASVPAGGTNMMYVPNADGKLISTIPIASGPRVEGMPEARRRLQAIVVGQRLRGSSIKTVRDYHSITRSEIKLPESWDEKYLIQNIAQSKNPITPPILSYDGKFLSLLYIKNILRTERFNSPIYSGDARSDIGICRSLETTLSQAWPGSMERCESWQWEALSTDSLKASKLPEYFYTINYSYSGIHPECPHFGECLDPIFSTTSFEYPVCGWFIFYRFQRLDGSKAFIIGSMDENFYLRFSSVVGLNNKKLLSAKSIFCDQFN